MSIWKSVALGVLEAIVPQDVYKNGKLFIDDNIHSYSRARETPEQRQQRVRVETLQHHDDALARHQAKHDNFERYRARRK